MTRREVAVNSRMGALAEALRQRDAARAEGYRQAIADLRDEAAFEVWFRTAEGLPEDASWGETFALWLESRLTEGTTDG